MFQEGREGEKNSLGTFLEEVRGNELAACTVRGEGGGRKGERIIDILDVFRVVTRWRK